MEKLYAISPLDGRYHSKVETLGNYFSEAALINYRIMVECEYFIFLNHFLASKRKRIKPLKDSEIKSIRELYFLKDKNALEVKKIEFLGDKNIKPTNHDVKAVEYYIKRYISKITKNNIELVHFALTSEDVNNISYSLMISSFIKDIYLKELNLILKNIDYFANRYASSLFPARTHGQIASPTTFGKEMKNFYERIKRQKKLIKSHKLRVKLNGAVGNYNAFVSAYPEINWIRFTKKFISHIDNYFSLNLEPNLYTTQIENHDSWIELFDRLKHLNNILIGFCEDIWRYISDELVILKQVEGEVGSSTMPHKVNPINFENAEGNLQFANTIFNFFSSKFAVSRMQRDLTDSTIERNIGVAFGHTILSFKSLIEGISKIELDEIKAKNMVKAHPEVYAEAIQTILRKHGIRNAYEILKGQTRGRKITEKDIKNFIETSKFSQSIKSEIMSVISKPYVGYAEKLAKLKLEE